MKAVEFKIRGRGPLMLHSERTVNPFDPLTKAMRAVSKKRNKTDDDLAEMARIEFMTGIYYSEESGVHVPGYNILACLRSGAKLRKLGAAVQRGVIVHEDEVPIEYDGPRTPEALFADEERRFVDVRGVKIGQQKVMRCRPIFRQWACTFTAIIDETILDNDQVLMCLQDAGRYCGLGDYRPRFGRFEVTS